MPYRPQREWPQKEKKGEENVTKAKARARAKAKAGQKVKKRAANAARTGQTIPPGKFDPGSGTIKGKGLGAAAKNFAGARRGAARSK